ncbi:RNA methyltransferase [Sphingomonas sp. Root710]|nr:RNA methyltransferase [Sphingomonas sp. Root710]
MCDHVKLRLTAAPHPSPVTNIKASRYELARTRQLARAWAATLPEPMRRDLAALFTQRAMESYRNHAYPTARFSDPFSKPYGRLDLAVQQLAEALGREAVPLPPAEALFQLTSLYTTLLDSRERSALGAFYTPPALAERLLDLAGEHGVDWRTASILDPASGGGAFLVPAARRMRMALASVDPVFALAQIGTRLKGFELDPYAAWFGQAAVEIELADLAARARRPVPIVVHVADTIEEAPTEDYGLVVGNPPYGRLTLTPDQRARFARSLYGHANLYGVFTDIAVRWAKPNGVIAYLTPTSFLGGQYFSALRSMLALEAPPVAVDFVQARSGVFEDVLQETLLAVYRRGQNASRFQVHYLQLTDDAETRLVRNGTVALPATASDPWLAPREPHQAKLIATAERMACRLADWGYQVSTGPLVWNRFKSQLKDRPSKQTRPLIWAEAVTTDGRFIHRAERRGHAPYFKIERGDAWLVVDQACVLVHRTTAKEQPRRLIAAELPQAFINAEGGVVVENHLNMVRPIASPKVSPAVVAAFLNSAAADQLFRCINGSVAVSAFELEALPLPTAAEMTAVERLVARGADRDHIEAAIVALYKQARV